MSKTRRAAPSHRESMQAAKRRWPDARRCRCQRSQRFDRASAVSASSGYASVGRRRTTCHLECAGRVSRCTGTASRRRLVSDLDTTEGSTEHHLVSYATAWSSVDRLPPERPHLQRLSTTRESLAELECPPGRSTPAGRHVAVSLRAQHLQRGVRRRSIPPATRAGRIRRASSTLVRRRLRYPSANPPISWRPSAVMSR